MMGWNRATRAKLACAMHLGLGVLLLIGCEEEVTEVILTVDTTYAIPCGIDAFEFTITGGEQQTRTSVLRSPSDLPATLTLVSDGAASVRVEVVGLQGAERVARGQADVRFQDRESLSLNMQLTPQCTVARPCNFGGGSLPKFEGIPDPLPKPSCAFDGGIPDGCFRATEACNGLDDDCDGTADEDFDLLNDDMNCGSCGNQCSGSDRCQGGECGPLVRRYAIVDATNFRTPGDACEATGIQGEAVLTGPNGTGVDEGEAAMSFELPFPFRFYGRRVRRVWVGVDGYVMFGDEAPGVAGRTSGPLDRGETPRPAIFPFWDELRTRKDGICFKHLLRGPGGNREELWITWKDVCFGAVGSTCASGDGLTFTVVLEEGTNDIFFSYLKRLAAEPDRAEGLSATIGVTNDVTPACPPAECELMGLCGAGSAAAGEPCGYTQWSSLSKTTFPVLQFVPQPVQ